MKIGNRCTICETQANEREITICETCGRGIHDPCEEYETTFECQYCGDEPWIDAVEF
ncbi:hypothetical protein [Natronococcus pandeyae]|uniref:hypothetical protein n=1 Tax=Natronococcus pandeyae TaxID=2055836 RepID=UPI001652D5B0|nr:hypothetical protein [Natronococcus pandeyae]